MQLKRITLVLSLALVFLPTELYGQSKTDIRIGVIAPLTGGLAERGVDIERTVRLRNSYYADD